MNLSADLFARAANLRGEEEIVNNCENRVHTALVIHAAALARRA